MYEEYYDKLPTARALIHRLNARINDQIMPFKIRIECPSCLSRLSRCPGDDSIEDNHITLQEEGEKGYGVRFIKLEWLKNDCIVILLECVASPYTRGSYSRNILRLLDEALFVSNGYGFDRRLSYDVMQNKKYVEKGDVKRPEGGGGLRLDDKDGLGANEYIIRHYGMNDFEMKRFVYLLKYILFAECRDVREDVLGRSIYMLAEKRAIGFGPLSFLGGYMAFEMVYKAMLHENGDDKFDVVETFSRCKSLEEYDKKVARQFIADVDKLRSKRNRIVHECVYDVNYDDCCKMWAISQVAIHYFLAKLTRTDTYEQVDYFSDIPAVRPGLFGKRRVKKTVKYNLEKAIIGVLRSFGDYFFV